MNIWYHLSTDEVINKFGTNVERGLSLSEVEERRKKYGPNKLEAKKSINPLKLFISQFKDALIIVLIISALVSLALSFVNTGADDGGGFQEAVLIFVIVLAIGLVGFFNEYRAEKTVEALKKLVGQTAKVRRGGVVVEIDASELVPGDIVLLEEGRKIPADLRLVQIKNVQVNEASLTGESLPVSKREERLKAGLALGDQRNMGFAGTFVAQGTAEGVVVAVGHTTELGKIASLVNSIDNEQTPMQKKLDVLGKKIGLMVSIVCVVVFAVVLLLVDEAREKDTLQRLIFAFTAAVALAVAAIPEGLAFVVRISLAIGARRMAAKNALVRRLSAVEALGSTDIICCDKTGTLTRGEMTVRELYAGRESLSLSGTGYEISGKLSRAGKPAKQSAALQKLLLVGLLCNNARLDGQIVLGDPTEGALLVSAGKLKLGYQAEQDKLKRIDEIPFTSERKLMTTVHKGSSGKYLVATKGAVEIILEHCDRLLDADGKTKPLTDKLKKQILARNTELAGQALRVLGFAYKEQVQLSKSQTDLEAKLIFTGLQAMMDPPRKEVIEVIDRVQSESGMRVVMITGDYAETAKAIADEIGIKGDVMTGTEIDAMSDEDFARRVEEISVYARVNPEHKIRIVRALKKHGHQVAMTGDGVNDAPAIKAADIGIAMGITGTDAAKEAADLILLDDQFLTIINAIEEGRGIFDNVRKFVNFLISCNIAEVIAILLGIIFFNNLLLTAAQLLFINIVTDGLPAVALGSDPARSDALTAKPSYFQQAIIIKRVWVEMIVFGLLMSAVLLFQFWFNHTHESAEAAVSAAFTGMVVFEMVRLVDIRTSYKIRWFSNPLLSVAIASSLVMQIGVLYIPPLAKYFGVGPLSAHDWLFMIGGSIFLFVVMKVLSPFFDLFGRHPHHVIETNPKPA